MKPTLSYEMHTVYTGALYLKAVMAFRISNIDTGHNIIVDHIFYIKFHLKAQL